MCTAPPASCASATNLHGSDTYSRVFVVSIGKAAHTMAAALEAQVGSSSFEAGIVSSSVESTTRPAASAIFAVDILRQHRIRPLRPAPILNSLTALDPLALAIFMISGGGSHRGKPVDDDISLPISLPPTACS